MYGVQIGWQWPVTIYLSSSLPVRFHLNYRASESGRLIIAVLFSLVLHTLLLFFIRFAQPSWKNPASRTTPLNVVLEEKVADVSKPAGIPKASQDSKGKTKIGVQETNPFPQKILTAVTHAQVDQSKTEIPKAFISEKILTVNKPAKTNMVESEPDLLVTKSPPPETPENEEKPFAPIPSVENPVATFSPPIEKLVSPEPTPGEKQEKIVIAEPAQEKLTVEKSGNSVEEPKPVKIEEPAPVKIEEPKPVKVEEPKPLKIVEPEPVKTEESKTAKTEKPAIIEAAAESNILPSEGVKSDVFRAKPPGNENSSLAELSIAAVRKFSGGEGKRIKFGERRKTIDFKEQELRYVMYIEGLRLKLERIGFFNYPAAAARNNQSGTLSVKISIRSDGSLEDFSIVRPSIYEALNAGAEKIVRMSAPFSPLPDNIRKDADILSITINWTFSNSRQSLD